MTQETVLSLVKQYQEDYNKHDEAEDNIVRQYEELVKVETQPHKDAKEAANVKLRDLLDKPESIKLFAAFKPGDFVKYNDEFHEIITARLQDDSAGSVEVRYQTWEIKWNGEKYRHKSNVYQSRCTLLNENDDKRLLKRVKKRVIERLEGQG